MSTRLDGLVLNGLPRELHRDGMEPYLAGDVECWTCSDGLAVGAASSRCALCAHLLLACAHVHRA